MIGRRALLAAGVIAVLALIGPWLSAYPLTVLTQALIVAILAMSLDVLLGYTGLASLGQAAYFGVGAYVVAIMTTEGYDATLTDVDTIQVGDPLLGGSVSPDKFTLDDVDGDGDLDVLLHLRLNEMQDANAISVDSLVLVLTAVTLDGIAIDGMDAVNVKSK